MAKVESFELDHTKVRAPYVRLAGVKETPKGDVISKYDLRLIQPNSGAMETAAVHTLEHLLATYLRDHLSHVLDVSPMGCRTGFYLTVIDEPNPEEVLEAFKVSLERTVAFSGSIPGVSEMECGNYRDHDLPQAKKYAETALTKGFIVQETLTISNSDT